MASRFTYGFAAGAYTRHFGVTNQSTPHPFLHFLVVHSKTEWDEELLLAEFGEALCMLFQVSNKNQGAQELIRS